MKKTASRATWGILFVLLGIVLAGRALNLFDFNIFFSGWWTLFIIVPCALRLSDRGNRTSSIIGLGIGILLLLSAQGIFAWYMFGRILVAFIFVVIGCSLILRANKERNYTGDRTYTQNNSYSNYGEGMNSENPNSENPNSDYNNNANTNSENTNSENTNNQNTYNENTNYGNAHSSSQNYENRSGEGGNFNSNNRYNSKQENTDYRNNDHGSTNHGGYNHFSGILSGRSEQFIDELFTGAVVSSILGNVQLDLRNAIFNGNAVIDTTCILGGVDIYTPSNVKVVVNCTSILAGVDNNIISPSNSSNEMYTLFINGTCILGGIEVK